MDQLQTRLDVLEQQMCTMNRRLRWWRGLACALIVLALLTWTLPLGIAQEDTVANSEKDNKGLEQRVAALESLLKHFSRTGNEVTITGANLHIVNGLGRTDCGSEEEPIPDCPNSLGNLIVGYNEPRDPGFGENIRTGSHNVVVGQRHNFSRVGGLVVGAFNTISGDFAAVSGGASNTASGKFAAVSGGGSNTASAEESSVSGGNNNRASGVLASVSGGNNNRASGDVAAVSGGGFNTASGGWSSVSGGELNTASRDVASVSGGIRNTASGIWSAVGGGDSNIASGDVAVVSGGQDVVQEAEFGWAAGSFGGAVSGSFSSP